MVGSALVTKFGELWGLHLVTEFWPSLGVCTLVTFGLVSRELCVNRLVTCYILEYSIV